MPTNNTHINYTAEDLLRYAQGKMSTAERHALEKAALDDMFLSEAMDGYISAMDITLTGSRKLDLESGQLVSHGISQLDDLRKIMADKAADKIERKQAPVVSMLRNKWLQTAVAIVFLFGAAGWLFSVFNNKPTEHEVAINMVSKDKMAIVKPKLQDSIGQIGRNVVPQTVVDNVSVRKATFEKQHNKPIENNLAANNQAIQGEMAVVKTDTVSLNDVAVNGEKMVAKSAAAASAKARLDQQLDEVSVIGYGSSKKGESIAGKKTIETKLPTYVFKGRILDNNNNPLPYSSVLVPGENVGTYSNSAGYFNFIYTDSVLPVRAKSLGFKPQNFNMHANLKENKIVLNEDEKFNKEIVFFKKSNQHSINSFKPIIEIDSITFSAEPNIGWNNYDLYLSNNNRISDLPTYDRSVQLSFEVDKNGVAKNITVDKSQGTDLDKEAIRLIQEGPKWKAKVKTAKGKVVVKF